MSELHEPLRFDARALLAGAGPAKVTLVGAGPGDPELLTVKAANALRAARVVLHDSLVSDDVLALAPADAHRIYVGKRAGCHAMSQGAIIELMLKLARAGREVLRLKGGDPYVFGRGGEEAQALAAAGVPFEVIPGITAAQGAAASAGMPLTHRDHARALVFATGHLCTEGRGEGEGRSLDLDWEMLARPRQTTVIYMGLGTLPIICEQLMRHGAPPNTPAAVIERATCPDERVVDGTLETLPALAKVHEVKAPALIVIGGVVALHEQLAAGPALRARVTA
jgi:uroporphyrin-III C-methyltransferase